MSLVLGLWDCFCHMILFIPCILGIYHWNEKKCSYMYEITWSIQTRELSLQYTPIPDMCGRKYIYVYSIPLVPYIQASWSNKRPLSPVYHNMHGWVITPVIIFWNVITNVINASHEDIWYLLFAYTVLFTRIRWFYIESRKHCSSFICDIDI